MHGYLRLQGLDLTYTILAHVISSDGSIIGVVSEPEVGRLVQYRDRTKVYDAIAQVQQRGLIFNGISYHKIHILHGKVRLSNLASIRYFADPVKLKEEGEKRHWIALDKLFKTLNPADTETELAPERNVKQTTLILLPDILSPERPLLARFALMPNFREDFLKKRTGGRARPHKPRDNVLRLSIESGVEETEADTVCITDSPLSIQTTRLRKEPIILYHPYRSRPRPKTLLLANSAAETETPHLD